MPSIVKEFSSRSRTIRFRILADRIRGRLTAQVSVSCGNSLKIAQVDPIPFLFFLWEIGRHETFSNIRHFFDDGGKAVEVASIYDSRTDSDRIRITIRGLEEPNFGEIRVPVRYFRERAQSIPYEIEAFITGLVNKNAALDLRNREPI